jgi:molecular chaperone GrpE
MSIDENNENLDVESDDSIIQKEFESGYSESEQKLENNDLESINNQLQQQLEIEKRNLADCKDKLMRTLADYQNLQKKTITDIENGVNAKIDKFMTKFLSIYDDFIRAKIALSNQNVDPSGFDAILKNIDLLLSEYNITPIDALGEIFDPNLHEAISVVENQSLDDGTITKEIRKGYISKNRVIRPSVVEISKKPKSDKSGDE